MFYLNNDKTLCFPTADHKKPKHIFFLSNIESLLARPADYLVRTQLICAQTH